MSEAREHFEKAGKLFPPKRPAHDFQIGRMVGMWRMASEAWSGMSDLGYMQTHYFRIGTAEDIRGNKLYELIVWRFALIVAFLDRRAT